MTQVLQQHGTPLDFPTALVLHQGIIQFQAAVIANVAPALEVPADAMLRMVQMRSIMSD